jgi:hypothetical protein
LYFEQNYWSCTIAQFLQLIGFMLSYGALVLKIWRECKLFYVRSVKAIEITDITLMKRLTIILSLVISYLLAWSMFKDCPINETRLDENYFKYQICTITVWNFISRGSN